MPPPLVFRASARNGGIITFLNPLPCVSLVTFHAGRHASALQLAVGLKLLLSLPPTLATGEFATLWLQLLSPQSIARHLRHGSPGPLTQIRGVGGGGMPSELSRARLHFSTGIRLSPYEDESAKCFAESLLP